jgi:hypothetical protein
MRVGDKPCGKGEVLAYRRITGHELGDKPCGEGKGIALRWTGQKSLAEEGQVRRIGGKPC